MNFLLVIFVCFSLLLFLTLTPFARAQDEQQELQPAVVPYVPTPTAIVKVMLSMAENRNDDTKNNTQSRNFLFDIGSGDGRICIEAIKSGLYSRAIGIEHDEELVARAKEQANATLGDALAARIEFRHGDFLTESGALEKIESARTITMYLLPGVVDSVLKLLKSHRPPIRASILSLNYPLTSSRLPCLESFHLEDKNETTVHLYRLGLGAAGAMSASAVGVKLSLADSPLPRFAADAQKQGTYRFHRHARVRPAADPDSDAAAAAAAAAELVVTTTFSITLAPQPMLEAVWSIVDQDDDQDFAVGGGGGGIGLQFEKLTLNGEVLRGEETLVDDEVVPLVQSSFSELYLKESDVIVSHVTTRQVQRHTETHPPRGGEEDGGEGQQFFTADHRADFDNAVFQQEKAQDDAARQGNEDGGNEEEFPADIEF